MPPATPPPAPVPDAQREAELEAQRDRAATERLLERIDADALAKHRARQAAGPLATITAKIARGAW